MRLYGVTFQIAEGPLSEPSSESWVAHAECLGDIRNALPPSYRVITMGATETDPDTPCALRRCGKRIGGEV